jgi:glucose uptake protein GlcU
LSSATFGIVSAFAVIADSQIDRVVSFIMPLAAIAIAITATGIVFLARQERLLRWWVVVPVVIVALAVGAGLAGKGDQESGRLELRPRSTTIEASTIPSFNI